MTLSSLKMNTIQKPAICFIHNLTKLSSSGKIATSAALQLQRVQQHQPQQQVVNQLKLRYIFHDLNNSTKISQNKIEDVKNIIQSIHANLRSDIHLPNDSGRKIIGQKGTELIGYQVMNRNARKPNKANHGSRPCSRISRRANRSKSGNSRRK